MGTPVPDDPPLGGGGVLRYVIDSFRGGDGVAEQERKTTSVESAKFREFGRGLAGSLLGRALWALIEALWFGFES
jgi:hypothetical protein